MPIRPCMTTTSSTAPRLARLALATLLALGVSATTAATAGAEKPTRGCTSSYSQITSDELEELFPGRSNFAELFSSIDKNDDGVLCAKQTPGLFNTVDNTSNQER